MNKGLNSETRPHKSEVQPTQQRILDAEHQNPHQNKIPDICPREHNLNNIEYLGNNRNNNAYKMSAQESVNIQLHTNYPVHTYENANILPQYSGPQFGERWNALGEKMVEGSDITNCRDNVHILNTNSVYQNQCRTNEYTFPTHSGPQQGERQNARREILVKGKTAINSCDKVQTASVNTLKQDYALGQYTGQPLIKSVKESNADQPFLYLALTQMYRR